MTGTFVHGLPVFGNGFAKDFDKFFVGFDQHFARLNRLHEDIAKTSANYPPYNIRKSDETNYVIELAVAGFSEKDISIETVESKLVITGNSNPESEQDNFVFKGIANRAFTRTFALTDDVVVKSADMRNGMLYINLERIIPERMKPKKIVINTDAQNLLPSE